MALGRRRHACTLARERVNAKGHVHPDTPHRHRHWRGLTREDEQRDEDVLDPLGAVGVQHGAGPVEADAELVSEGAAVGRSGGGGTRGGGTDGDGRQMST